MNSIILKKSKWDNYKGFKNNFNEETDKSLMPIENLLIEHLFSAYEFITKTGFYAGCDLNEIGIEDDLGIEILSENTILLTYYDMFDGEIIAEITVKKDHLLNLIKEWYDLVPKNPEEIILYQVNNNEFKIEGKFPYNCQIKPFLLYRRINLSLDKIITYTDESSLHFIRLIFYDNWTNKNTFETLLNFLNNYKNNKIINVLNCQEFQISILDDETISLKDKDKQQDFKFNVLYDFIKNMHEILIKNPQEIIISQNDDDSYKVQASYEPIEEFPKYRCYP